MGEDFICGERRWRCTDIGTRTVAGICLDDHPDDPSWYRGPPYPSTEHVFDEYDQDGCHLPTNDGRSDF